MLIVVKKDLSLITLASIKKLETEEQIKPKIKRRKEMVRIRAVIYGIENRKTVKKINTTKSWFFEEIQSINL